MKGRLRCVVSLPLPVIVSREGMPHSQLSQVFFITGAARGLGFAFVKDLAEACGHLALVDLYAEGLEQAANSLRTGPGDTNFL